MFGKILIRLIVVSYRNLINAGIKINFNVSFNISCFSSFMSLPLSILFIFFNIFFIDLNIFNDIGFLFEDNSK